MRGLIQFHLLKFTSHNPKPISHNPQPFTIYLVSCTCITFAAMSPIKNILFDLGGVLLDIDYNLTTQAFHRLGYPHFEEMYSQYNANLLFEKLETGHVSEGTFYAAKVMQVQETR